MRTHSLALLVALAASLFNLPLTSAAETEKAAGKPKPAYQAVGAPAQTKVDARWNRYHDYAQATELLKQLAAAHPGHVRLKSLGKSHGGREMWQLTITAFDHGDEAKKPAFYLDGGIHANEIQTVELTLYTAWYLAEMYGQNPWITELLNDRVFYIVPMVSPDSRDAHMYEANTTHSPRTGQIPVDDDRDGLVDEDGPNDLDGDGHITMMRIRDPHGRWKSHPKYPALMIEVKPEEQGEFTLLGSEGYDDDGDGLVNEDGDGNYDPNRDWAWNWQAPGAQYGAHRYPFSIQENRLVADFIMSHPNIAGANSFHNSGGMILRPPGARNDTVSAGDTQVYTRLGKQGEEMLPGYRLLVTAFELYEVHGSTVDWLYNMLGVMAFTNEMNAMNSLLHDAPNTPPVNYSEKTHNFDRLLLFGGGFADWTEVDHPQYGKISVGGQHKSWSRQPAAFMLEEELHRNMGFVLFHAHEMPQVRVDSITVKPLPGGLQEVTACIVNPKLTPTHTDRDVELKLTPPDRVRIEGEGLKVIAALTDSNLVFDKPVEHKRRPEVVRLPTIGSHRPVYVRWIVQGDAPYTVTIESVKGGQHSKNSDQKN